MNLTTNHNNHKQTPPETSTTATTTITNPKQLKTQLLTNAQIKDVLTKERKNYYGKLLLTLVLLMITFQYILYIYIIEYPSLLTSSSSLFAFYITITRLILFHILFAFLLTSLYLTSKTNPGTIPLYWGFYIGDQSSKKKRYCLICQVFKPDRTHHCSICNICVLNMDHHCPWINNCIGFYNKKYFIQMLIYFLLSVLYLDIIYIPKSYTLCIQLLYKRKDCWDVKLLINGFGVVVNHLLLLVLTVLNCNFLKFHLELVLNNCTTIESLDEEFMKCNKYNISYVENWEQVFGKNKLYWFIPVINEQTYPKGDGLTWPVNNNRDYNDNDNDEVINGNKNSLRTDDNNVSGIASFLNMKANNNNNNYYNTNLSTNYRSNSQTTEGGIFKTNTNLTHINDNAGINIELSDITPVNEDDDDDI